jgi:hypothetical protein
VGNKVVAVLSGPLRAAVAGVSATGPCTDVGVTVGSRLSACALDVVVGARIVSVVVAEAVTTGDSSAEATVSLGEATGGSVAVSVGSSATAKFVAEKVTTNVAVGTSNPGKTCML